LKCAWIVEEEEDVVKAKVLLEYFAENFGEFYDNNQEFIQNLSQVRCVPAENDGEGTALYRFCDIAAPKDRHLCFRVMPVLLSSCAPPQVMFSRLEIVSPPPISVVLHQVRDLTEDEGSLDHWTYKHGSAEQVFSAIFSFLQDNFSDLSPRVKEVISERHIVPVGSSFVKASRLFFRLAKDLAPFFYEVPRAFGAYDVLLRQLGVRDSPKSGDYAISLVELKREIGAAKLNANELNSVIEVVNIAASEHQQSSDLSNEGIHAPDQSGRLISVRDLTQNDRPWLVHSGRIDVDLIHLVHPKLSKEMCNKLQIKSTSQKVIEVLDDDFILTKCQVSTKYAGVIHMLRNDIFADILHSLVPRDSGFEFRADAMKQFSVEEVEEIRTRFIIFDDSGNNAIDVTNKRAIEGPLCFIDKDIILLARLPIGLTPELAIATALCDKFHVQREHVAGIAAVLSSRTSHVPEVKKTMGLFEDQNNGELLRGEPGQPLVVTDLNLTEIKPLKTFKQGEIVAVPESDDSPELIYGTVSEIQDSAPMTRLRICVGVGMEKIFLSSQVYSLRGGSRSEEPSAHRQTHMVDVSRIDSTLLRQSSNVNESTLEDTMQQGRAEMTDVKKEEVLTAVQDLLKSADLSLNDDAQKMMDSNLALKEQLSLKMHEIKSLEKKSNKLSKQVLKGIDAFLCPITRDPMEDPVICCDGHTYEREAIEMWLRNNSRSPKTNQPLPSRELIPNHALRSSIEAMVELQEALKSFAGDS